MRLTLVDDNVSSATRECSKSLPRSCSSHHARIRQMLMAQPDKGSWTSFRLLIHNIMAKKPANISKVRGASSLAVL